MQIISVVGARPNFIKLAALHTAFSQFPEIDHKIIHTGQHYDFELSQLFFQELRIPVPHYHLNIGSGSHAEQVGKTMMALEELFLTNFKQPDWVLAIGDVNGTIAVALVTKKLGFRLAHVEAGLRSFDWAMPEEINRIVSDRLSDLLFVPDPAGVENLLHEGHSTERIKFVGNVMIDTLKANLHLADQRQMLTDLELSAQHYGVITLHRPSNTDVPEQLQAWMDAFEQLSANFPLVFPVHPRTRSRLKFVPRDPKRFRLIEPIGYLDMLALQKNARFILTDSGGIQPEATMLGVPCLTLRDNTEWPVTLSEGTNSLVGSKPHKLAEAVKQALSMPIKNYCPLYWEGRAGERIAHCLIENSNLPLRDR